MGRCGNPIKPNVIISFDPCSAEQRDKLCWVQDICLYRIIVLPKQLLNEFWIALRDFNFPLPPSVYQTHSCCFGGRQKDRNFSLIQGDCFWYYPSIKYTLACVHVPGSTCSLQEFRRTNKQRYFYRGVTIFTQEDIVFHHRMDAIKDAVKFN